MGHSPFYVLKFAFLLVCIMNTISEVNCDKCRSNDCIQDFQTAKEYSGIASSSGFVDASHSIQYCLILRALSNCLRSTGRFCRGEINYHSVSKYVVAEMEKYNCSHVLGQGGSHHNLKTRFPYQSMPMPPSECTFHERHPDFRYCGLFGDPHLRTFDGQFMTCKNVGAWPLIDNSFLTVQITNSPVVQHGTSATATTKITVSIREHRTCSRQKIYEAQGDQLPSVFIDGAEVNGPNRSAWIVTNDNANMVEIHIGYIATSIIIRKDGGYLNIAIRIPKSVAEEGFQRVSEQLCLAGCAEHERIDHDLVLSSPEKYMMDLVGRDPSMARDEAVNMCREMGVTDFYFDACVFDLLATGNHDFSLAAKHAQKDILKMFPKSAKNFDNRTELSERVLRSAGAHHCDSYILLVLFLSIFFLT